MATKKLTEYERRRLENIKRNEQVLASLKIHSKLSDLSATVKRKEGAKSYRVSPQKKVKTETPVVIRRSLRTQGISPDSSTAGGLEDDFDETLKGKSKTPKTLITREQLQAGPLGMRDAFSSSGSDEELVGLIRDVSEKTQLRFSDGELKSRARACIDLDSMKLEEDNVARVVPGRIMTVKFLPAADRRMIVVGNKTGDLGFWDVDCQSEDDDGIYVYHPHTGPVSGIAVQPFSLTKIITSCYDGFIRLLDVEKEMFDLVRSSDYAIFSISQRPNDSHSLYFGEGPGVLGIWDERTRKTSSSYNLHDDRINTIDFNSENANFMATSSTDGTACIWDVRNIDRNKPKSLKVVNHKRAVHSAYFSPSGSLLATTSIDDKIGLLSGANYEDESMIYHNNQTGRWISTFRSVWGWDDSYIFVGNMKRGVDVLSALEKKTVATFVSPLMTAIPCRFDAHPFKAGLLAGATSGGQVYIWSR